MTELMKHDEPVKRDKTHAAQISGGSAVQTNAAETATALMAAKAEAEAKARYAIAIARPRDEDLFRQKILKACTRPRFAEAAVYDKPVGNGKTVKGLSVRFAEAAMQYFGNLSQSTHTLVDDDEKRIVHCSVVDLETNAAVGQDIVIEKFVERKKPRLGDEVISSRENSYGQLVYRIRANEEALLTKVNNLQAKLRRGLILQLIPGDVLEECLEAAQTTSRRADAEDPDAAKRRLLDSFAKIGINARQLKEYVGIPLEQLQDAHIEQLRGVFQAIQTGEATWQDYAAPATTTEPSDRSANLAGKIKKTKK